MQYVFKLCRPFLSKEQYEAIGFANAGDASLLRHVAPENLPPELGGSAKWSMEQYVRQRALAEGVRAPRQPRPYKGKRLDVAELQALDEK